jgi:hypothetical protein
MMKSRAWLFAATMSAAAVALAQTAPQSTVTETTDPAKIAEIERHAQELASRNPTSSTASERNAGDIHRAHSKKHKAKAKAKRAMQDKAPPDQSGVTEGK